VTARYSEATRLLVPALQQCGYRFVRLDAIPQVQSAMRVTQLIALRSPDGRFLVRGDDDALSPSAGTGERSTREEPFGVVALGEREIALVASNGQYLTARPASEPLRASAAHPDDAASLQGVDLGAGRVALRAAHGYLTRDSGERLFASAARPGADEAFLLERQV
jgi:hypothetical protein